MISCRPFRINKPKKIENIEVKQPNIAHDKKV